eukprot:scaffold192723_cov19-Prasinocladus_malaysianus.AAC.1
MKAKAGNSSRTPGVILLLSCNYLRVAKFVEEYVEAARQRSRKLLTERTLVRESPVRRSAPEPRPVPPPPDQASRRQPNHQLFISAKGKRIFQLYLSALSGHLKLPGKGDHDDSHRISRVPPITVAQSGHTLDGQADWR